jgi:hypothetical protein
MTEKLVCDKIQVTADIAKEIRYVGFFCKRQGREVELGKIHNFRTGEAARSGRPCHLMSFK